MAVCGLVALAAGPAGAQDGTLRISESALDDFAAAVRPHLTISRQVGFTVWVPNPFLIPPMIPVSIGCTASASVSSLGFDVTSAGVTARGTVRAQICGIDFQASASAPVQVFIDSTRSLRIIPGPMLVFPRVSVLGITLSLPVGVNLGQALGTPTFPLQGAPIDIETPAGARRFNLVTSDLSLSRASGRLEVQGNVRFR